MGKITISTKEKRNTYPPLFNILFAAMSAAGGVFCVLELSFIIYKFIYSKKGVKNCL